MIGHLYVRIDSNTNNNATDIMCKNTIILCTKCAGTTSSWGTCADFVEFRKRTKAVSPETTEWIDTHGAAAEPKMMINITIATCKTCINKNGRRKPRAELYESVNGIVDKLAGIFTVRNSSGDLIMPVWKKEKHDAITREIETDTETETESESDSDNEDDNESVAGHVVATRSGVRT